jgi:hypothetical protein
MVASGKARWVSSLRGLAVIVEDEVRRLGDRHVEGVVEGDRAALVARQAIVFEELQEHV